METILYGEHSVWKFLKKDRYTKEGIKKTEQIYDFLQKMKEDVGVDRMRELFDMWNEYSDETFWILSNITHDNE
ncbi:hypothetical protein [Konateibacter massiliensis]|uniref:hypothetical protein n=1 Tax=Konateibacter massiliensis TaxID=2002841 RepID=UPI000C14F4AC|nr:hypothetical protein [Konateibacter massiliensis]